MPICYLLDACPSLEEPYTRSKLAALDACHQVLGALVEVDDFHNGSDCTLSVKVGIQSLSKTAALQD